jgi:nucleotide-binding universal stress UspA family protein
MFKKVLVGIDGTPRGRDAIALALQLSDAATRLTLAHVHSPRVWLTGPITPAYLEADAAESWRMLARENAEAGLDAQLASVLALTVGRGLHLEAAEQHADLIVIGSCGRGFLGRAAIGDDTRASINGASCAVAVAPHGYAGTHRPLTSVGIGFTGTPESDAALAAARELASATRAALVALEVVPMPAYGYAYAADLHGSARAELDAARARLARLRDVEGHAVHGVPAEELATFSGDVDLLVVGSRGYGPARRLLLGSTSDYLARHARCSLLVMPRPALVQGEAMAAASGSVTTSV